MTKIKSDDVRVALRKRYPPSAWFLAFEVSDGGGMDKTGSADAIAMSLWPSRGYKLHGHEIKVSRADWKKEMDKPEKSGKFVEFCEHWWLVTPKGVAEKSEVPNSWGHMLYCENGSLRVLKDAPQLRCNESLPLCFTSSLLRNMQFMNDGEINKRAKDVADSMERRIREEIERDHRIRVSGIDKRKEKLAAFKEDFESELGNELLGMWNTLHTSDGKAMAKRFSAAFRLLDSMDLMQYAETSVRDMLTAIEDIRNLT